MIVDISWRVRSTFFFALSLGEGQWKGYSSRITGGDSSGDPCILHQKRGMGCTVIDSDLPSTSKMKGNYGAFQRGGRKEIKEN